MYFDGPPKFDDEEPHYDEIWERVFKHEWEGHFPDLKRDEEFQGFIDITPNSVDAKNKARI